MIEGYETLEELVSSLKSPRKVMLMVRAGKAVDELIAKLVPLLDRGDIIIDGGNSDHADTSRRVEELELKGLLYVGAGVSGGEEGALKGPAIMPGGSAEAWPHIKPVFTDIAAKADDGSPCCEWIGPGGAGHFVKMVHNGIEYGDMQLIAEAYSVMKNMAGYENDKIADVFETWNEGKLQSYLIEITSDIFQYRESDGSYLIDNILDTAGQKGTGKLSVFNAMELGVPLNLISAAVFERSLSYMKDLRVKAASVLPRSHGKFATPEPQEIHDSLYASKLVSYAQGFELLSRASEEFNWNLDLSSIARIWRNGCIIRSVFLNKISDAYSKSGNREHLLMDSYFRNEILNSLPSWSSLVAKAAVGGFPLPAFSSALNYFYSLTSENLPSNLLQAQRDYFGAHTFERRDSERGIFFHENWTGEGGETSSGVYNV
jgi:6-phosphogluconate dehydrogenase